MKTRLTNKYLEFVKQIESELSKPFSTDSRVVFSVFPSLGTGHFSIQLVEGPNPFLLVRQWNQDLGDSYQLGIYNLDSVKFEEKKLGISDKDLLTIRELAKAEIEVKEMNGIILDGVDFELTINRPEEEETKTFHWRTAEQISNWTKELIKKLVDVAGLQQRI